MVTIDTWVGGLTRACGPLWSTVATVSHAASLAPLGPFATLSVWVQPESQVIEVKE